MFFLAHETIVVMVIALAGPKFQAKISGEDRSNIALIYWGWGFHITAMSLAYHSDKELIIVEFQRLSLLVLITLHLDHCFHGSILRLLHWLTLPLKVNSYCCLYCFHWILEPAKIVCSKGITSFCLLSLLSCWNIYEHWLLPKLNVIPYTYSVQ